MGLGKTLATLSALDSLLDDPMQTVLIVAPLRVAVSTWPGEVAKWRPSLRNITTVVCLTGTAQQAALALRTPARVYAINFERLPWLLSQHGDKPWPYTVVVVDESTRLKGFRTRQGTVGAKALAKGIAKSKAGAKGTRVVLLTGTPVPNGIQDLWGQYWFLDHGRRLGSSFWAFTQRYFMQHPSGYGYLPLPNALSEVRDLVKDITLQVRAEDHFDLDIPVVVPVFVDLPSAARKIYKQVEKVFFADLGAGGSVTAANAAVKSSKLLQIAGGAVYTGDQGDTDTWVLIHDEKIAALKDIVSEMAGDNLIVAYQYKSDLVRLRKAFPSSVVLDKDPETLAAWTRGDIQMLLLHPASAGHGLNLQDGGHRMVFFSHWWHWEQRVQAIARIGPMRQKQSGHKRLVYVYNIIARDTLDTTVLNRLDNKQTVHDLLLGVGGGK